MNGHACGIFKQKKCTRTCLSMGMGSAFKRQTLRKHCPTKPHAMPKYERNQQNKPRPRFLQLVWSSASPAARPRPRSRVTKNLKINKKTVLEQSPSPETAQTSHRHYKKQQREPTDSPGEPKATKRMSPARQKRRQRLQKDVKRDPKTSKKGPKTMKKHEKERQVKTLFFLLKK